MHHDSQPPSGPDYVSTGHLPDANAIQALIEEAHARFAANTEGENSQVYPALARVPSQLFGVCVIGTSGHAYAAGDHQHEFSIMSVSKPFVFALVCQTLGWEEARRKVGVNATGLPFNSVMAVELNKDRTMNPMVNAGAIATTSLVPGKTADEKWAFVRDGLSKFAGRPLELNRAHPQGDEDGLRQALTTLLAPRPAHRDIPGVRVELAAVHVGEAQLRESAAGEA